MFVAVALPSTLVLLAVMLVIVGISGAGHMVSSLCGVLLDFSWLGLIVGIVAAAFQVYFILSLSASNLPETKGSTIKNAVLAVSLFPSEALSVIGMGQVLYAALVMFAYADFNDLLTIIASVPALILCGIMLTVAAGFYLVVEGPFYCVLKSIMRKVESTLGASACLVAANIVKLVLTVGVVAVCQFLSMEIIPLDSGFNEYVLVGPVAQINDFCYQTVSPLSGGII